LLLGYKPVQHVTVLNIVGNCNTVVRIIMLWDHRRICDPSLAETSICDAYLYQVWAQRIIIFVKPGSNIH